MSTMCRRSFLGTALAGAVSSPLLGAYQPAGTVTKQRDDPAFQPSTLFLTWQRDPTTTMTVQWVGAVGETSDTRVSYATDPQGPWQLQATKLKPYPQTDLKVFR